MEHDETAPSTDGRRLLRNLPDVQNRATGVVRTLLHPGSGGSGGFSRKSSLYGKLVLAHNLAEYASCRFAAWYPDLFDCRRATIGDLCTVSRQAPRSSS